MFFILCWSEISLWLDEDVTYSWQEYYIGNVILWDGVIWRPSVPYCDANFDPLAKVLPDFSTVWFFHPLFCQAVNSLWGNNVDILILFTVSSRISIHWLLSDPAFYYDDCKMVIFFLSSIPFTLPVSSWLYSVISSPIYWLWIHEFLFFEWFMIHLPCLIILVLKLS